MNATALVRRGEDLINPVNGEVVHVATAATDQLARLVDGLEDAARQLAEARAEVAGEVIRRMDKEATWTARVAGFELKSSSPSAGTTSYDAKPLRQELLALAREGVVDKGAVDRAVEVVNPPPVYKAKKGGLEALRKLGVERVVAVIDKHTQRGDPPRRSLRVSRIARETVQ